MLSSLGTETERVIWRKRVNDTSKNNLTDETKGLLVNSKFGIRNICAYFLTVCTSNYRLMDRSNVMHTSHCLVSLTAAMPRRPSLIGYSRPKKWQLKQLTTWLVLNTSAVLSWLHTSCRSQFWYTPVWTVLFPALPRTETPPSHRPTKPAASPVVHSMLGQALSFSPPVVVEHIQQPPPRWAQSFQRRHSRTVNSWFRSPS